MWTVTVDSNMPVTAVTSSASEHIISDKYLKAYEKDGDVEKLLGSPSPIRARSSSVKGRPPSSAHSFISRSRSPSSISRRQAYSVEDIFSKFSKDQQQHLKPNPANTSHEIRGNIRHRPNNSREIVIRQATNHGTFGISGSQRVPLKADYNMSASVGESYNGISPPNTRSNHQTFDEDNPGTTHKITRSSSLSRLDRSFHGESTLLTDSHLAADVFHRDARDIQSALEDSESQRRNLMFKLKEAQATLELQSERLSKIESSAKDNSVLVENLKLKEKQYRSTITQLELSEGEKKMLQMDNLRLQEGMQNRINALDYQLRSLKSQHQSSESKNNKNITLLDHTTTALSLLEEESLQLQQDKEKLQSEILLLRESFELAKARCGSVEEENRNMRNESVKLKEVNTTLSRKLQEMAGQMIELHELLKAVRDENERLISTLKTSTEDKSWIVQQIQGYQDTISHLKLRLSTTSTDRDRLFKEKLDMISSLQQMMFDKEQLAKTQNSHILERELSEQLSHHSYSKAAGFKQNVKETELAQELASVMKVKEEVNSELIHVKGLYDRTLAQVTVLDQDKCLLQSQYDLSEQERYLLQQKLNRLVQENTRKKQFVSNQQTASESEKLSEEHAKLLLEYNNLKHEYDSLVAKHQQLVINYGQDGEMVEQEKQEVMKLKKEKDAVQKQVTFLQGQILLMEGSKKRADEQIYKLTSEVEELLVKLKESSKNKSLFPKTEGSLTQEVEMLKLQQGKAKEEQGLKSSFIENLTENCSGDGRSEVHMKDKLHDLFGEIERKNQTIENLQLELKSLKEMVQTKQSEVLELNNIVEEMKRENQTLRQDVKEIKNSVGAVSQEPEHQTLQLSKSVKTLQEQLLEAVRSKQDTTHGWRDNTNQSKSLDLQSTSDVPFSQDGSSHLENPISKHYSQGDSKGTSSKESFNSLPRFEPSKLFSKSWGPAPKVSVWGRNSTGSFQETATSQPTELEGDNLHQLKFLTNARKLPPPPPPKPSSMPPTLKQPPTIPATLSAIPSLSNTLRTPRDTDLKLDIFNNITTSPSTSMPWTLPRASSNTSLSSSGLGQSTFSNEGHDDSHEQRDINMIINKFDEMAAF